MKDTAEPSTSIRSRWAGAESARVRARDRPGRGARGSGSRGRVVAGVIGQWLTRSTRLASGSETQTVPSPAVATPKCRPSVG